MIDSPAARSDAARTCSAWRGSRWVLPARQWVMVCPLWFGSVLETLANLHDDVMAGDLDPVDLADLLTGLAADVWAVASGYPAAEAVDLADPTLPAAVVQFLSAVLSRRATAPAELLPGWMDAVAEALNPLTR